MLAAPNHSTQPTDHDFLNRSCAIPDIAELTGRSHALIWIALDRLRQVNLSFGHLGGDKVLAHIGQRLLQHAPAAARWYRMSGDEFLCLLPDIDPDAVERLARQLLSHIETPIAMGDLMLHPAASIGLAQRRPNESPAVFLARTDHAMHTAKHRGGGCIVTSGEEPLPGKMGIRLAHQELKLENQLHQALAQGGLRLHYQPTVDSQGRVVALEALMRCPQHGISPAEFIPIAEKTGLIVRLGEWSLLEGARFAHQLQSLEHPPTVSINVSRAQLAGSHFRQTLHAALLCANVESTQIELELTESLFMEDSPLIQANLAAIRESGVRIAIDDFGTGYSSLATLKHIHANKLKIDRAFVVSLPDDRRAFAIVRAIARLGEDLGMQIVAEGAETQDQVDALHQVGIRQIQGYVYARPMPEDALLAWLQDRKTT